MSLAAVGTNKSHWYAKLALELGHSAHGTQLLRTRRTGPLSVQKAFYPEGNDCAHLYLLHPPAGIVSGDELHIEIDLQQNAHGFVTTPGANRFYRARTDHSIGDPKQVQFTHLNLAANSVCEHFPLETLVYDQAQAENRVEIRLQPNSVYCGWDISCLGLPSSAQPFVSGSFNQLTKLYCADVLLYHDRILVKPENRLQHHVSGLASAPVFGTMLAYAPETKISYAQLNDLISKLREKINELNADSLISITLINQVLIVRYLGEQANQCKDLFIALWQILRPELIGKPARQPRIWYT